MRFEPQLTAHRGKLLSGSEAGSPVFAGSFLRKREIVLDAALVDDASERARILVHELFHFVWLRLGNPLRKSWSSVLEAEKAGRARGELGWSSEWRKCEQVAWRDYICESFCDTAAWCYSGLEQHPEFTLASRWRKKRQAWFEASIAARAAVRI